MITWEPCINKKRDLGLQVGNKLLIIDLMALKMLDWQRYRLYSGEEAKTNLNSH